METTTIKASADVGNSSSKIIVCDGVAKKARKQQTLVSYLPAIPTLEDDDLKTLVGNLHKNMVVNVTSPHVTHNGLYAVGDMAGIFGGSGFNIKHHKKSDHNITIIQPLAIIAATAIQNEFELNHKLPGSMEINVEYTTAIPVIDYSKADAKQLEKRLTGTHYVVVYIAEGVQVQVTINIKAARVVQEGIPAFYAILQGSPTMFDSYNMRYKCYITGSYFVDKKLLFVDIGEGTTELIAIVDGKPILTKSKGIRAGVGHAAEKAMKSFKSKYNFKAELTRASFMKKVLDVDDKWHNEAKNELRLATFEQENEIFDGIIEVIENTLESDLDEIVIFGGGTNVFTNLENRLYEYADRYKMRVLWITGKEASLLNAIGLDELNNKVFFKNITTK